MKHIIAIILTIVITPFVLWTMIAVIGGDSNPYFVKDVNGNINGVCVNKWEHFDYTPAKNCWEISRKLF
jgi:hypothetical protein